MSRLRRRRVAVSGSDAAIAARLPVTSRATPASVEEADVEGARRNARFYLIGSGVSAFGDMALSLAAGIWVKELTGSSASAGLVSVCVYAPSLLGPVAGVVVDRVRRRAWLVRLHLVAALVVLALLAVRSADQVWLIYAVMTGYGLHLVLVDPAESALFAQMLPEPIRQRLNGWQLGLREGGRLVAPLVGAALFATLGGGAVALIDSLTFLVAAWMIARLRFDDRALEQSVERNLRDEFSAGFGHIWRRGDLRGLVIAGVSAMGISAVLVPAQFSLVEAVGKPPAFLGVFSGLLGAGSIAASLLSSGLLRRFGERWLVGAGLANFGIGTLLYATGSLVAAIVGSLVLGFALPWLFLAVLSATQRETPLALQGRVSAAVTFGLFAPLAPLQAIGAYAITELSYRQLYLIGTGAIAVTTLWFVRRSTPMKVVDGH